MGIPHTTAASKDKFYGMSLLNQACVQCGTHRQEGHSLSPRPTLCLDVFLWFNGLPLHRECQQQAFFATQDVTLVLQQAFFETQDVTLVLCCVCDMPAGRNHLR